ncbi:hypothetical protein [Streptomyces sp. NPDC004685]
MPTGSALPPGDRAKLGDITLPLWKRALSPLSYPQCASPAFHQLWAQVAPQQIAWANERCAQGNFRAFAPAHIIDSVLMDPLAYTGSALPEAAFRRLGA